MGNDGIIDGLAGNDRHVGGTLNSDDKLITVGRKVRIIWRAVIVGGAMYGAVGEL